MVFECVVPCCDTIATSGLHSFPANEEISREWIRLTKTFELKRYTPKYLSRSHFRVCRKHFKGRDFDQFSKKSRLLKNVFPSVLLPEPLTFSSEHNYGLNSAIPKQQLPDSDDGSGSEEPVQVPGQEPVQVPGQEPVQDSVQTLPIIPLHRAAAILDNISHEVVIANCNRIIPGAELLFVKELNRKRKLELKEWRKEKSAFQKKLRIYEEKIDSLELKVKQNKLSTRNVLTYLSRKLKKQQYEIVEMQVKNAGKKCKGRRYTPEQKSISLAIYKQSPKAYRFLKTMLILPVKKTIGRHSAQLNFTSGIDPKIFAMIKEKAKNLPEIDRYCILSWDETALKPHLDYDQTRDVIDGFVEMDGVRRATFATHDLIFMVRGIHFQYKQPVANFLTDGLKAFELAELIKRVTEAVVDAGLTLIGSTSDQVGTNTSAIDILIGLNGARKLQDGRLLLYKIGNTTLIHCYDPPHLIKVLRNNLVTKDLKHKLEKRWNISDSNNNTNISQPKTLTASWDDVTYLYHDNLRGGKQQLAKITEEHIKPERLKMKVSVATQIFSQTYGNVMLRCSERKELPPDVSGTAQILLFFNDLFDSINGSGSSVNNKLKSAVTGSSIHFEYWEYALKMLSNMYFVDKNTQKRNNRSSVLLRFESTIRGYIELTKQCLSLNMTEVSIRTMNQDGLENLFGVLRECCHNGGKLTASSLRTAYCTAIVNNMTRANSTSTNCEQDSSVSLINDVHAFLLNYKIQSSNGIETSCNEYDMLDTIIFDPQFSMTELNSIQNETMPVVSFIYNKIFQTIYCKNCKELLKSTSEQSEDGVIIARKVNSNESIQSFASTAFTQNVNTFFTVINEVIPHFCCEKPLIKSILSLPYIQGIKLDATGCPKHDEYILMKVKEFCVKYALTIFCKNVNNLLTGKIKILTPNFNNIEELALLYRKKGKQIGKYSDKYDK